MRPVLKAHKTKFTRSRLTADVMVEAVNLWLTGFFIAFLKKKKRKTKIRTKEEGIEKDDNEPPTRKVSIRF